MLEWQGLLGELLGELLGGLGPKCCPWGMKLGLGPYPWGWKPRGDPRRKVLLGWGCCEGLLRPQRIGVGHGQWLGWGYWKAGLGRSRGGAWPGCCVAGDGRLDTIYRGGGWPDPHRQLGAQELGRGGRGQACGGGVWAYGPIGRAHHAVLRGGAGHKA